MTVDANLITGFKMGFTVGVLFILVVLCLLWAYYTIIRPRPQ